MWFPVDKGGEVDVLVVRFSVAVGTKAGMLLAGYPVDGDDDPPEEIEIAVENGVTVVECGQSTGGIADWLLAISEPCVNIAGGFANLMLFIITGPCGNDAGTGPFTFVRLE